MKRAPGTPTKAERRRIGRLIRRGKILVLKHGTLKGGGLVKWDKSSFPPYIWMDDDGTQYLTSNCI